MGKFRSKLKGSTKGKRWAKGQSSSSNPETRKHRDLAKSRFFQEYLGPTNLTSDALKKHDAVQVLAPTKERSSPTEVEDDSKMGSSECSTFQTMDSFASEWSQCSNMSFSRFLRVFRSDSALHKEMLAVLAAVTEVIKQNDGTETPTEYYCALLTTLEQILTSEEKNEDQITAVISLINMGIKTVPEGILRSSFDDVCKKMLYILNLNSPNNVMVKSAFGILTILLRAQDAGMWSLTSTSQVFGTILNPFCVHSKPKWRKGAQQAAAAIVRSDAFMKEDSTNPASDKVAEFCREVIDSCTGPNALVDFKTGQTTILHILGLIKETVSYFSKTNMKKCCESLLGLMTLNYPMVTSCCLQVLYVLFSHQNAVVPSKLNSQLITALYEYQPPNTDTQSVLAWLNVMQQAHIHLADTEMSLACVALPRVFSTLVELWLTNKTELITGVTHALERLLKDAIAPLCETTETVQQHISKLEKCFNSIESGLSYQYNMVWKQVLYVIGIMFEVGGKNCSDLFLSCLKSLAELRDSYKFSYNNELEHTVGAAIRSLGPEVVLNVITLKRENQEMQIERSWLVPVLKENVRESTLEFWVQSILSMAISCQRRSIELQSKNDRIGSHSFELLYLQLWNLLPSFCNKPSDIKTSFKSIAKTLGTAISEQKELRLAVMASLRKLITFAKDTQNAEDLAELQRFDKNFLPILFNVYTTKPNGTDEEGQRLATLDTIKMYLSIAKPELTDQLFCQALERLKYLTGSEQTQDTLFSRDSMLDLIRALIPYQNTKSINKLYQECIKTLPEIKNGKHQKKAYRLLEEICGSDSESCKEFLRNNRKGIQKLLIKALESAAVSSKGARLRCLNYLVKAQPQLTHESTMLKTIVPEAILCCKDVNEKCRAAAFGLLNTVGETLSTHNQLQEFVIMLSAGLTGTPQIMSATILALTYVLHNFSGALGSKNIQFILENIGNLLTAQTREIVSSCLSFIKTYCICLPSPMVGASIPIIMKALTHMTEDCKRHFRLKVRDILDRLVRKYGCDSLTPHIPVSDTVMYKRLRNLRKLNARKKKRKEEIKNQETQDGEEEEFTINTKPRTIEEMLADSDSDLEQMDVEVKNNTKQRNTWIQEDADTIVDFTDPKATSKITATKPTATTNISVAPPSKKKKDGGFKVATDGRLIIKDDSSDSDSDSQKKKNNKFGDSDFSDDGDDSETMVLTNKKRKRSEAGSVRSAFSGKNEPSMKYQAGGSGIHRPISTVSVRSGFGSEYKAKKASGDVKKKGKVDPYAYVPLKRSFLNKRKKAKMIGQFKTIGKAAKIGARKGAKAKRSQKKK